MDTRYRTYNQLSGKQLPYRIYAGSGTSDFITVGKVDVPHVIDETCCFIVVHFLVRCQCAIQRTGHFLRCDETPVVLIVVVGEGVLGEYFFL